MIMKIFSVLLLLVSSTISKAEIFSDEKNLRSIFEEFERFARDEFLNDYLFPVEMGLKITGASYTPMNGSTGFINELNDSVGKSNAVKAHITLFFSKNSFSENYSREGFAWIACHELGHLVGGYPVNEYLKGFSSQEGLTIEAQADCFASDFCMGKWLDWVRTKHLPAIEFKFSLDRDPSILESCQSRFDNISEAISCETKLMAAAEGFRLIGDQDFKYHKIDNSKTDYMYTGHPKIACRGATVLNAVMGFERPSCWYYPEKLKNLDLKAAIQESLSETVNPKTFCGKMRNNLEIIQKNFEKNSWEPVWAIKNFKKMAKKYKRQVNSMMDFCETKSLDDSETSEKYLNMISEMQKKLRFNSPWSSAQ